MSYIKLQVRAGGIYIRQTKDFLPIDLNLISHPENSNQKVLSLVRDSSIKGLFSYLMGETKKIKEIENSSESSIKKLDLTLDKIVETLAYKKRSEPHITVFFERRDVHTKNIISPSSISLQNYSIDQAESTIRHLEKPLKNIIQDSPVSLVEIHSFFKQSLIKPEESDYKKGMEYILNHLEIYYKNNNNEEAKKTESLIKTWKEILKENELNKKEYNALKLDKVKVPEYNKLETDLIDKLKQNQNFKKSEQKNHFIEKLNKIIDKKTENKEKFEDLKPAIKQILENHFNKKFKNKKVIDGLIIALKKIIDEKPISSKVIKLIEEIYKLVDTDPAFADKIQKLKKFQFSSFTNLGQTKAWVDPKHYPVVRGTPAYIACVDFDVYLSDSNFVENNNSELFSWEEIVNKLVSGPNIARWGEGGVVFIDYSGLNEMGCPYNKKDQMFVEIQALRKAGLKIKKYDWEQEKTAI